MKIPRDISSTELARLLKKYEYIVTHQAGSHIRLTSNIKGSKHNITIPDHKDLKVGTLNSILNDIARYLEIEKENFIQDLFS